MSDAFFNRTKHPSHATFAKEALDLVGLPNALYSFDGETLGPKEGCGTRPLKLTINKELGYEQCGVLIPNTYFGAEHGNLTAWARESAAAARDAVPFGTRRPVALY